MSSGAKDVEGVCGQVQSRCLWQTLETVLVVRYLWQFSYHVPSRVADVAPNWKCRKFQIHMFFPPFFSLRQACWLWHVASRPSGVPLQYPVLSAAGLGGLMGQVLVSDWCSVLPGETLACPASQCLLPFLVGDSSARQQSLSSFSHNPSSFAQSDLSRSGP